MKTTEDFNKANWIYFDCDGDWWFYELLNLDLYESLKNEPEPKYLYCRYNKKWSYINKEESILHINKEDIPEKHKTLIAMYLLGVRT